MDESVAVIGDWVPPSPSPMTFFSAMLGDGIGKEPLENHRNERLHFAAPDRVNRMDESVAVIGDWVPPSPSPMTFFSAMLGDGIGKEPLENHRNEHLHFAAPDRVNLAAVGDMETRPRNATAYDFSTEGSLSTEHRSNPQGLGERIAARAGFSAPRLNTEGMRSADLLANPVARSPYLTIPPGLSPTTLLDSPVFLSNSLPSPTTGKFPFFPNNADKGSSLVSETSEGTKTSLSEGNGTSLFAFKPRVNSDGSSFLGSGSKVNSVPRVDAQIQSKSSFQSHNAEQYKIHLQNNSDYHASTEYSRQPIVISPDRSHPLDDPGDDEGDSRGIADDPVVGVGGEPAEDGYNWRKYGQKQVKGSEYPRSYYKCTHANCAVKKKVERSHEGHITEIIYKGMHKHPKPLSSRQLVIGGPDALGEVPKELIGDDGDLAWTTIHKAATACAGDWRQDNNHEMVSWPSKGQEVIGNHLISLPAQNRTHMESADQVDGSSTFSNDEGEDDQQTHTSVSMGYDGEGDESESKRRKIEDYASHVCGAIRAVREPRVVVQTTSEVDVLDDGYRWRKYGQKVVKGNPNPRSYYKCTSAGCSVRKHVERASHDLKSVITTYEGKHNHDVPAARNSNHTNSGVNPTQSGASGIQNHRGNRPGLRNMMTRFDGPPSLYPFNFPGGRALGLGPYPGFPYRMSQTGGLANLGMAGPGPGPGQGKLPMMPVLPPFLIQKEETASEPGLNLSNGSTTLYQQMMNRLPLGHQM